MTPNEERLMKIYELALNGVDGEKDTAKALLDKLMTKYGVSLDSITDDNKTDYYLFKYKDKIQEQLLTQTVYKVTNKTEMYVVRNALTGRVPRTKVEVKCTAAQRVEIEFLYDFYCSLWEKEQKALLSAFIQKHKIFGDSQKNASNSHKYTQEELDKMRSMMNGLSDETPHLRITEGTSNI